MFETIKKVISNIRKLDYNDVLEQFWSNDDIQEIIIDLNTKGDLIRGKGQLFDLGIDSKGRDLGDYAPFTIEVKQASGLPYDHITLYQDGIFYRSFYVVPNSEGFKIEANPIREDTNLFLDFGADIVGLTADSKEILSRLILTRLKDDIKNRILQH